MLPVRSRMTSPSGLFSGTAVCDVENESLDTSPTVLPVTTITLADAYRYTAASASNSDISTTETIHLSASIYSIISNDGVSDQQQTHTLLDTPENSLTQIVVLSQESSHDDDEHADNIAIDEHAHTCVDESDPSPEIISQVTEIGKSSGIFVVMKGGHQFLSIIDPYSHCPTTSAADQRCVELESPIDADVQETESPEKETLITPDAETTMPTHICLRLRKEDGSWHKMQVIPANPVPRLGEPDSDTSPPDTTFDHVKLASDHGKRYACDLCTKTFSCHSNYKRHRRIHIVNTKVCDNSYTLIYLMF